MRSERRRRDGRQHGISVGIVSSTESRDLRRYRYLVRKNGVQTVGREAKLRISGQLAGKLGRRAAGNAKCAKCND